MKRRNFLCALLASPLIAWFKRGRCGEPVIPTLGICKINPCSLPYGHKGLHIILLNPRQGSPVGAETSSLA